MKIKDVAYVIVQAGGEGTRLEHYTFNKPKCLLSIDGEPLLYHLFRHFSKARFIIIGDYLYEVLEKYLRIASPTVDYELVRASGKGTLAGMNEALSRITRTDAPFNIVWSDLLFGKFPDSEIVEKPVIGLSRRFLCRWSLDRRGKIVNLPSDKRGIAGFFSFPDKTHLNNLPPSGELVKYLSDANYSFETLFLDDAHELGSLETVYHYRENRPVTRFFNSIEIREKIVVKQAQDPGFENLIEKEVNWYEKVSALKFKCVPRLISRAPLTIERINGIHAFDLSIDEAAKRRIIEKILDCFAELHQLESMPAERSVVTDVFYQKSIDRVRLMQEIIPNVSEETLNINNLLCRNPFHEKHAAWFRDKIEALPIDTFSIIHGDPTFSNILIDELENPWLIDPRGYFADISFFGDRRYDWAKLYYSVVGNYDQFNRKRFRLKLNGKEVNFEIESNGWESQAALMRERFEGDFADIELIHASVWISLSGYVRDDLDSVFASFYNGLYWLEKTEA